MATSEARNEARFRLDRAIEFLDVAEITEGDSRYCNATVSMCASSAIAAADAVLALSGNVRRGRVQHDEAPGALRAIRQDVMASTLTRLLRLKPKAQYSAGETCTPSEAVQAMQYARKMLALAHAEFDRRTA